MTDDISRLHATVHGKVQGVRFRYFTMQTARQIGVTGWVRNRLNQTVELVAEGSRVKLDRLLEIIHIGPAPANVTQVDIKWEDATREYKR